METQPLYNLDAAIAGLRRLGLNEDESRWLAGQRAAAQAQPCAEVSKTASAAIWRGRVSWMAGGLLFLHVWTMAVWLLLNYPHLGFWSAPNFSAYWWLEIAILLVPLLALAVLIASGRMARILLRLHSIFNSRTRFVLVSAITVLITCYAFESANWQLIYSTAAMGFSSAEKLRFELIYLPNEIRDFALIVLIAWLMPAQPCKTPPSV